MADDTPNALGPGTRVTPPVAGDVPERLRKRYFTDDLGGPGLGFYVDATVRAAAFRDRGRELIAVRTDPNAIRDMVAIAQHRGWSIIDVRGAQAFRREAWLAASATGLDVRGYKPTERDFQDLTRRLEAQAQRRQRLYQDSTDNRLRRQSETEPGPQSRLKIVETIVRAHVADETAQARIMTGARSRLATWLERGARFDAFHEREREALHQGRSQGR